MPQAKRSGSGLKELEERKRELLLESDINRQIIRVEVCQLKLKATDWRRNLLKARAAYNWMAPVAGIGFALYGMRKKQQAAEIRSERAAHNGHGKGIASYLGLLSPVAGIAVRKAFDFWRHARKRGAVT